MQLSVSSVALAALAGGILGTAWDRMHVAGGALTYAGTEHPQPWWVPAEFAFAGLVVILGVRNFGDPLPDRNSPKRALGEVVWFSLLYAATALLWRRPAVVVSLLLIALIVRAPSIQRNGVPNALPSIALVIIGPLLEAAISAAGLFEYARPDVAGIPLWLPILYMNAVPLIARGTEAMLWAGRRRPAAGPAQP